MSDDITLEPDDGEGQTIGAEARLKTLRTKLGEVEKQSASYLEGWQRAKADYINLKRRSDEERGAAFSNGISAALEELLPFVDSLDEAVKHSDPTSALGAGLVKTLTQLDDGLNRLQVEKIGAPGEMFDPSIHESVSTVAVENKEDDNTIITVLQKGYKVNGRTLRPARVSVGHYKD